jgi:hypothetical protein
MFGKRELKIDLQILRERLWEISAENKSLQWQIINPPKYNIGYKHCCHGECVDVKPKQDRVYPPCGPAEFFHHWEYTFKNDNQTIIVK